MTAGPTGGSSSRRRFLGLAGLAAAAGLSGCATSPEQEPVQTVQTTVDDGDVAILNGALDLENLAVAICGAAIARLDGADRRLVRRVADQEREHAEALAAAVRQRGAAPNLPRSRYDVSRIVDRATALGEMARVEDQLVGAYWDALPRVISPDVRATMGAIATSDAEHAAVVAGARGRPIVTGAFVRGAA